MIIDYDELEKAMRDSSYVWRKQIEEKDAEIELWKKGHKALCEQTLEDGKEIERLRSALLDIAEYCKPVKHEDCRRIEERARQELKND